MVPRKTFLKRAVLVVTSAGLALALAEVSLRWVDFRYSPMAIEDASGRDDRLIHLFEPENFVTDPALLWRPRANHSVFNSQGFRGRELNVPKAPGEFRIFAVGDSNTLGWAGDDGGALARLLGRDARKGASRSRRHQRWRVGLLVPPGASAISRNPGLRARPGAD